MDARFGATVAPPGQSVEQQKQMFLSRYQLGPLAGQLQDVMIRRGLIADTIGNRDEFYGPATLAIVKQFQADHGLETDARVAPKNMGRPSPT